MQLGRLTKLDLRDAWKNEPRDFTQWLSQAENISLLGEELGLDIAFLEAEAHVGDFYADILAQEETNGKKIIIENQLEPSDHRHLGQILTYAAGLQAEYIIWIVREAREEHQQAIDWLNAHTDDSVNLFLIRVELWKIGNSEPAPKFVVVSRPNDWARAVRAHGNDAGNLTNTKLMQLEFWQQLREYATQHRPPVRMPSPRPQHWYNVAIGRSDCHITLITHTPTNQVSCELYIPDNKPLFHALFQRHEDIQVVLEIVGILNWQELPDKKASRIRVYRDFDFTSADRTLAFQWLTETTIRFMDTFTNYLAGVQA
ncbi:DUF4268 domain-containing protein [Acidithiobacillus sp. CV18-2]|nr:DUF4268 domain-containing protein [Acidithiobacillus sp. CV18-3]MBU2756908.1 DUF4268 domain-containing protein [Acidithiobacillus sp. BN09-2]MBU2777994.1 DUF4268 domain-containing protein [Acidithiobacillus sp. CV18-2]MBU2799619.1 DUF4268 domain-containing protein [Acidithiobacillus sp. VAN18-4]